MRNVRWWLWLLLAASALFLVLTIRSEWQTIEDSLVNWSSLTFLILLGILLVLWRIPRFRRWVRDTIGEGAPIQRPRIRFLLPTVFIIPFVLYVLLSGVKKAVPPATEFSLLVIAPTLGGLVLTAAGNRRIRRIGRIELISVAQKLITVTVLLIVFTSLFFTVDLTGGIDLNSVKWSFFNVFRWACYWGSALTFYAGAYLFLLGITDLVRALRHLTH